MVKVRTKLLVMSAKENNLKFSSIVIDGTEVFYDEVGDGCPVWIEVDGDVVPCPDIELVVIEDKKFYIKDSTMFEVVEDFEGNEGAIDEVPVSMEEFNAVIDALIKRVEALEERLAKATEAPIEVDKYGKKCKTKKIDLSAYGL